MKSIVLLSGGLDSLVSLDLTKNEYNVELAITFNYGQKSAIDEINTSKNICEFYKIEHQIIPLNFLKDITRTSIVTDAKLPTGKDLENSVESAKSVWVPNRNGLFLNIAGAYCDSYDYDYIVIGANNEEAQTFPDNSQNFIDAVNKEFEFSTLKRPKVVAPLINFDKNDIVKIAIENNVPLDLVMSCYKGGGKHCGICESCVRLKNALKYNNAQDLIKKIFG